jgi:hypothetical protein
MLNYSQKALRCLQKLAAAPGVQGQVGCFKTIEEVVRLLKIALNCTLPENGIVGDLSKALDVLSPDMISLPEPVVALQFHVSDFSKIQHGECAVSKRIALCIDCPKGSAPVSPLFSSLAGEQDTEFLQYGGILVIPIYFIGDIWMPNAFGAVMIRTTTIAAGPNVFKLDGQNLRTASVPVSPFPLMPEIAHTIIDNFGIDRALRDASKDTNDELLVLAGMLVARSWAEFL